MAAILIIIATYPAVFNMFSGRLPVIKTVDYCQNMWYINKVYENLVNLEREGFFRTGMVAYPFSYDIRYNIFSPVPLIIYSLIISYNCFAFSFNLLLMLVYAFNFLCMYLLARRLIGDRILSLASAFIFISVPHLYWSISQGKVEVMLIGFIPLALLYTVKMFSGEQTYKNAVFAGVYAAATSLTYYHNIFMMFFFILLYGLIKVFYVRDGIGLYKALAALALLTVIAMIILAPFIATYYNVLAYEGVSKKAQNLAYHSAGEGDGIVGSLFRYPNRFHILLAFLLLITMPFAGKLPREAHLWLALLVFFWILSLGNSFVSPGILRDMGINLKFPMPLYILRKTIPFFSRFYWPSKFSLLSYSAAAMYLMMFFKHMKGIPQGRIVKISLLVILVTGITADMTAFSADYPYKSYRLEVPKAYSRIEGRAAVLIAPLFAASQTEGIYQIWHKSPIVDIPFYMGARSSLNDNYLKLFHGNIFLENLTALHFDINSASLPPLGRDDLEELRKRNIKYVLLSKNTDNRPSSNLNYLFSPSYSARLFLEFMNFNLNMEDKIQKNRAYLEKILGKPVFEDEIGALFAI